MANDVSSNRIWNLDTAGIISYTPVVVRKVQFIPNAATNVLRIDSFSRGSIHVPGSWNARLATIGDTNRFRCDVITDDPIPATVVVGSVLEIMESNGDSGNIGRHLVSVAGDGAQVTVTSTLVNESNKLYSWRIYLPTLEFYTVAAGTGIHEINFEGAARRLPGFILRTLTAGRVMVYLA